MTDITEVFNHYLDQYDSIDIAEAEFKKNLHEDSQLRDEYRAIMSAAQRKADLSITPKNMWRIRMMCGTH